MCLQECCKKLCVYPLSKRYIQQSWRGGGWTRVIVALCVSFGPNLGGNCLNHALAAAQEVFACRERRGRCRTRAEQHIVQSNSSKTDVFFSLVIRVLVLAISNTRAVLEDAARPRAQYSAESPRVGPPQVCAGSVGSAEKIQIRGI